MRRRGVREEVSDTAYYDIYDTRRPCAHVGDKEEAEE